MFSISAPIVVEDVIASVRQPNGKDIITELFGLVIINIVCNISRGSY